MRKRLFVAFAFLILAGFSFPTTSAQLPIKIPKIPKPNQPKPKPSPTESAQPAPTRETQPAAQPQPDRRSTASQAPPAGGQDQLAIAKDTLQVTAYTHNFYRKNFDLWSWVPRFEFRVNGPVPSGGQFYVEYTIPGAGPAVKTDCETTRSGSECGGRGIPEDKSTTYTGPVNFAIKLRNELAGTDSTLFSGRMKVAKTRSSGEGPKAAGEFVYYVDHDWNLPIGYVYYTADGVYEWNYPRFNAAFWVRGDYTHIEAHLFYKGQEVGRLIEDGIQVGAPICGAAVENGTTHFVNTTAMPQEAKWKRMECSFPMVKRWDKTEGGQGNANQMHMTSANPGEYEVKVLWNKRLARSIKFTVGPDGTLDNRIAAANKLGSDRVIVPVTIIGDQDGTWDRTAWKTDAFYGNPLTGFTPPQ